MDKAIEQTIHAENKWEINIYSSVTSELLTSISIEDLPVVPRKGEFIVLKKIATPQYVVETIYYNFNEYAINVFATPLTVGRPLKK